MSWKLSAAALGVAVAVGLAIFDASNADGGENYDPTLIDPTLCLDGDRNRAALKFYLAAAAATKTELGPIGRQAGARSAPLMTGDVPLFEGLGKRSYRITTANPRAQRYFDQGLAWAYAFNHAAARRAFLAAQAFDPECAMCYWGEAFVLGPNINMPMDAADNGAAVAAVRKARELASRVTLRELALIDALAARYSADPAAERAKLNGAYADAMQRAHARFVNDREIAVLYADALMNLSPWDYWEAGGAKPKGRGGEIVATLERVLAADSDHPGAIHLYIHAVEASSNPQRAERYADRLGNAMPGAGHLVHMPSHIYYRVGRYRDSLEANKRAVAADERYFEQAGKHGIYGYGYYPHNIHFLLVSAQMAGDGGTVIQAAEKLAGTLSEDVTRSVPWVQPIMAAPYFAHAQFSEPAAVLGLPAPGPDFPYTTAMWHYARGLASVNLGDVNEAQKEADSIARIAKTADMKSLVEGGVPAYDVLEIAGRVLLGRIAQAKGDLARAAEQLQLAIAAEDKLAYMEPPFWYYPVRQTLGAVLLAAGDLAGAEEAFRASLVRTPNNAWALFGLAQVYERKGDPRAAAATKKRFDSAWAGPRGEPGLARL